MYICTWDGQASEGDVHVVVPGGEGRVLNTAAPVLIVLTRHLGLGRTLDGQAQTPGTGSPGRWDRVMWKVKGHG